MGELSQLKLVLLKQHNFVLGCYTTFPRADKAQNWRNAPFQAGNIYAIISKWHIMDFNHYVAVFARGKK